MKYFKLSEFDSPDSPGSGVNMKASTLSKLEVAREIAGVPFNINSAYRTAAHNKKVKGKSNSAHQRGHAIDISVRGLNREAIVKALVQAGFKRIGIADTYVHADDDPSLPQNAYWGYPSKTKKDAPYNPFKLA